MDILSIENLQKNFGENEVINDLNFSVPEHSVFGFLGQNGAGKTTTMNMILGLLKPTSGSIKVCGELVTYGETKTNRFIGYLPDVPEFYNYMTPKEYLNLCGEITGMPKDNIRNKSEELLSLVGLENVSKRIGGFSRGMKQRLGIAQALLSSPKLLICDEPTSALDPTGRKEILDILEKVKRETTVLFSTHILSDAERICDRIAVLHNGKLVMLGSIAEIKERYKGHRLLIEFKTLHDLEKFKSNEKIKQLQMNSKEENMGLIIETLNSNEVESIIIGVLAESSLFPHRLEALEPSLENLYLEVVK